MDKLSGESMNLIKDNIEKLGKIFPNVIKEGKVDFEELKLIFGEENLNQEKYQFTWSGKINSIKFSQTPSTSTLLPCVSKSKCWESTSNIYIEGDNFEVLKLLQKTYYGKISTIYIDPPYNTGSDFVYNDKFEDTINNYLEITNQKTKANPNTDGKYHTNWLNMMYSRLILCRNLLTEDGVIFISIDDNELFNLKKICDEIFGENNFVANLPTVMNLKGNNDEFGFAGTHEYTLVYIKNIEAREDLYGIELTKEDEEEYIFEDSFGKYKQGATLMRTGVAGSREKRPKGFYPIYVSKNLDSLSVYKEHDDDYEVYPRTQNGVDMSWRRSPENLMRTRNDFIIKMSKSGISFYKKQRLNDDLINGKKPKTLFYKPEYSSGNGTKEVKDLFNRRIFDGPKPLELIKDFLRISLRKGIVLDFFSGSATTAHAVMELNKNPNYDLKYILVQLPELFDKKDEGFKAGYLNICEFALDRIKLAGKKIYDELKEEYENSGLFSTNTINPDTLDFGFKVFKLDSTNLKPWDGSIQYDESTIFDLDETIKEGRNNLDVAYEIMLKYGIFNMQLKEAQINNKTMYSIGDCYMIICLDNNITMDDVTAIAMQHPKCVVFKEAGLADDNVKINATYTLERLGVEDIKCI